MVATKKAMKDDPAKKAVAGKALAMENKKKDTKAVPAKKAAPAKKNTKK